MLKENVKAKVIVIDFENKKRLENLSQRGFVRKYRN